MGEAEKNTMISLDQVRVRLSGIDILHGISLDIPAGQITAVVGRSGAGKTTLIRVLNGLITPTSGTVRIAGIGALDNSHAVREHQRRTATIFQDHALIGRLPAIDNVLLGLADTRFPLSPLPWKQAQRRQAAEALDDVGLLHRANAWTSRLSGGERQRVGVARALVRKPGLLLGDEPFASVDPSLVRHLSGEFRQAVLKTGLTLVIVLHQIETALTMADRIVGMKDGRIAFTGTPDQFDADAQAGIFPPSLYGDGADCFAQTTREYGHA